MIEYTKMVRILIIGDDVKTEKVIRDILELRGFNVIAASNVFSVMRIINDHIPDLIFMDASLHGIDCITLTTLIKANSITSDVPVITFISDEMKGGNGRFVEAVCDGSINIHLSEKEILRILNKYKLTEDS